MRIVEKSSKHGKIEIEYYSQDDLHRIYDLLIDYRTAVKMVPAAGVEPATYGL